MAPTVPVVYTGQKESRSCLLNTFTQMMVKSKKFSKRNSRGFIPDYRHAVESMAESEGFGASGQLDKELTLSEVSCIPQKKCINLNEHGYDCFGIPTKVLSLSKLSKSERKGVELRLKRELKQVRVLQNKGASLTTNAVVLSPASDIHSCSNGQKRPALGSTQRALEQSRLGKKHASSSCYGPCMKRCVPGLDESVNQVATASTSSAMLIKQCEDLLNKLMSHQYGWVFNAPVDAVKLNIPDYFMIIKHPMDLGTIKGNIAKGEYLSPLDFAEDVRLTFSNAMNYNPPGNDFHFMAKTLNKFFDVRWRSIEKKIRSNADLQVVPSRIDAHIENVTNDKVPPLKKNKVIQPSCAVMPDPIKRIMKDEEKHKLSMELEALLAELPESIINFLKENSSGADQPNEDEIEIDIDALGDDTLFKLRKLLDDYLLQKDKNQAKFEPCKMELHNESGFSNSSMQPCKGKDAVNEVADICGHDHPVSSFPPSEIERDSAHKNNNSSSSSSGSGSSSSDSDLDSGSFSGSECDGVKTLPPMKSFKETICAEVSLDQNPTNLAGQGVGRIESNCLRQAKQNMDGHREEESAPSEKQISPEKLYRAALLRSRFADTILKAQEKTLEKVEKQDPEKLRLEREELEQKQREEKARLQAEAMAAEKVRKKAEAEAAAEAKRKRELEREAARLALQEMERTVDVNENCGLMEDLKLLSSAPVDNLSTFLDNASECENDHISTFKLRGSINPLEQLGLYIKVDFEEEDEAGLPPSVSNPIKDDKGKID
ncbi:hypothetical protein Nepgr_025282 [Nepenthes gracilis]|uniref:Transcription factor GTE10-like n=1 Tax=Nepenthes gracilis TaxID=150966 RepID=A0AAD3T627_NEPGR|nr:hypothetical protein Nepgr_025282 [Nepenthes gracilis]